MFGNRGIYHTVWTAVTERRTPWETGQITTMAFDADVRELYDTSKDWPQARDLSKEEPEMLHKLQQLWLIEAVKYNVLPLDDRFAEHGGGLAKGANVSLYVDGQKAGEGRVEQIEPFPFGEESMDIGHEAGSPATTDYPGNHGSQFSGQVNWVEFDTGIAADDQNHLISSEERLRVAMAKQ